jgi:hypothetical protein
MKKFMFGFKRNVNAYYKNFITEAMNLTEIKMGGNTPKGNFRRGETSQRLSFEGDDFQRGIFGGECSLWWKFADSSKFQYITQDNNVNVPLTTRCKLF